LRYTASDSVIIEIRICCIACSYFEEEFVSCAKEAGRKTFSE